MTLSGEPVRWLVGKQVKLTRSGDVYGNRWDAGSLESLVDQVLEREYHKNLIYQAIKSGHSSVRGVSGRIGLELQRVSHLLADMEKTGMVEFKGMEDHKPVFEAVAL